MPTGTSNHSEAQKVSELIPLSHSYRLYLKHVARVSITVQLPTLHDSSGRTKSFTTWEIIQKLRQLSPGLLSPPTSIKTERTTLEWVRFTVNLDCKADVKRLNTSLDSQTIKLSGFPQNLRVRSCEAPFDCPRRHDWEAFFRDSSDMDETKIGERPDTMTISGLPVRWFVGTSQSSEFKRKCSSNVQYDHEQQPCPEILAEVFQTFGQIRRVDIPSIDPVQNPTCLLSHLDREGHLSIIDELGLDRHQIDEILQAKSNKWELEEKDEPASDKDEESGFGKIGPGTIAFNGENRDRSTDVGSSQLTFKAYIQYVDYNGFQRAMEGLRGQKMIYFPNRSKEQQIIDAASTPKENSDAKLYFSAELKVNFDRQRHLSDALVQYRSTQRTSLLAGARRRLCDARDQAKADKLQRQLRDEADRIAQERQRAQLEAKEAERRARRDARAERKRQQAIDRCRQVKEQLLKRKIHIDECLHAVAVRRVEAIRLMTVLLRRVQERHDAVVEYRRNVRAAKKRANQQSHLQQPPSSSSDNSAGSSIRRVGIQPVSPTPLVDIGLPEVVLPDSSTQVIAPPPPQAVTNSNDEAVLLEKLLVKREEALRKKLLERLSRKRSDS